MKKSYKFGEILLYVREEYKEYNYLLNALNKCIHIPNSKNFHFEGQLRNLSEKESRINLIVEKEYSKILKKIQWLKYDWYSKFLYTAYFNVIKNENNIYNLEEDFILTPIDDNKRFVPLVDILYPEQFCNLIDKLFSLDIMKLQKGNFYINYDSISLDFGNVFMSSNLGYKSLLYWDGNIDTIDYSVEKDCSPNLLECILNLNIPINYISSEWLQIFEKHEDKFSGDLFFNVDIKIPRKKGTLQIDTSNNRNIKLLRKKL